MISKPSFPLVFGSDGTSVAASYSSECRFCEDKPRFNASFYTRRTDRNVRIYYKDQGEIFLLSTQSAFEISYLEHCTNEIDILGASFEGLSDVYNANHDENDQIRMRAFTGIFGHGWSLTPDRLQSGWFMHRITSRLSFAHPHSIAVRYQGHHLDVEYICEKVNEKLDKDAKRWLVHQCEVPGCAEGYFTIDGNEKIRRSICAKPREIHISSTGLKAYEICANDPQFGNKDKQPKKFCELHKNSPACFLQDDSAIIPPSTVYNLRSGKPSATDVGQMKHVERGMACQCKDASKVNKFYKTTAGIMAAIKPCGIVLDVAEMLTAESLTHMFLFILQLYRDAKTLDVQNAVRFIGYDRACELKPFLMKLAQQGHEDANNMLQSVDFLVDIFHVEKHSKPCCSLKNPACAFHPKLSKFAEIAGVNTESCEQGFRRLNRYKYVTKKLTRNKRKFFFYDINDRFNTRLEKKLKLI